MKKLYVKIDGIHCNNCKNIITKSLMKIDNIKDVKIKNNIAIIKYEGKLTNKTIIDNITSIDYLTKDEYISDNIKDIDTKINLYEFIIILGIIVILIYLVNKIFKINIFNMIPNIDSSITYPMLVITGLFTSIHCISMCGAINIIAVSNKNKKAPIFYNMGRIISYTLLGGIVGLIGKIISINDLVSGLIVIIASILMLIMALNMLGIIDFNIFFKRRIKFNIKSPFIIGLLNGFMPCGPLQSMQLYALSTGSFITGALSMFLFSLGTLPLMLFIGYFINIFKGRKKIFVNKIASILVLILSISMLNRGLLFLNINLSNNKLANNYDTYLVSEIKEGMQVIDFDLEYNGYKDILVMKDIPVKIIIHVSKEKLTSCNNEIVFRDFNIKKRLVEGDNIIEFTPVKVGSYTYSCWMNMLVSKLEVIDDITYFNKRTKDVKIPVNVYNIDAKAIPVILNNKGNIIINEEEITTDVTYYSYVVDNITIGLLAVRDSKGKVHVVVNTCESCSPSPYAFYIQEGTSLRCENCGNLYKIDNLDNLSKDDCNPIRIKNKSIKNGIIEIDYKEIESHKDKFINWMGPK